MNMEVFTIRSHRIPFLSKSKEAPRRRKLMMGAEPKQAKTIILALPDAFDKYAGRNFPMK